MKISATGFVALEAGSVASANATLLCQLLKRGVEVSFFSKPTFVDPRGAVAHLDCKERLKFVDCTNRFGDGLRRCISPGGQGLWGRVWGSVDTATYNRGLVRRMNKHVDADVDLWMGDWARGRGSRPVVSYVQGPPGTDARSVFKHRSLIENLAGKGLASKLRMFSRYRLTLGLPRFQFSDHIIVGSQWSRSDLINGGYCTPDRVHALPYPIDLNHFRPEARPREKTGPLRLLWLGRFVPRKRLDLFLDGMRLAISEGCDVEALVIGSSGFVPNYEKLIHEFPFPNKLKHVPSISRSKVPSIIADADVLVQPSDDENFGSSVAEALACGIPSIVGATNGTGDYICERSIRLNDDKAETMAVAIATMADAKKRGELVDSAPSRSTAESFLIQSELLISWKRF